MIEEEITLPWSCLSRVDTLDEEMLVWMKKAGCVRINIGIETGSQRLLDFLDKGVNLSSCKNNLVNARNLKLELMGFFLTGIPNENIDDLNESISFAKKYFNFVAVDTLKVYPGTPLFEKIGHDVQFSLMPYQNEFKDKAFIVKSNARRSFFYRKFYFSINFISNLMRFNLRDVAHLKVMVIYVLRQVFKW
jgi:radical SAM superfamily enzyme YgiQ (UPF0313 family)